MSTLEPDISQNILPVDVNVCGYYTYDMINFREIIRSELERQGKSAYWLGGLASTPTRNTVYRYLRGELDVSGDSLGQMLDALGLEIGRRKKTRAKV